MDCLDWSILRSLALNHFIGTHIDGCLHVSLKLSFDVAGLDGSLNFIGHLLVSSLSSLFLSSLEVEILSLLKGKVLQDCSVEFLIIFGRNILRISESMSLFVSYDSDVLVASLSLHDLVDRVI